MRLAFPWRRPLTGKRQQRAANKLVVADFPHQLDWTLRQLPRYYSARAAGRLPAVKKAIQRLATDVASLPMIVEQRGADGLWTPVDPTDPEARLITERWTTYETAALGVERVMRGLALHGIAAVIVGRGPEGELAQLLVVDPRDVTRQRVDTNPGAPITTFVAGKPTPRGRLALWYWEPAEDGVSVRPPLAECWPAVRAGLAATAFAGGYFDLASVGRLVLKPPQHSPPDAAQGLIRKEVQKQDDDGDERRKAARGIIHVLDPGWDALIVPVEGRDVVIDMRKFAVEEVSRILGPPQPMLDHLDRATYSNIAQARRDYLESIISTWGRKIGSELTRAIWPHGERRVSIRVEDATIYSRSERLAANQIAIFSGQMTQDEARAREGLEPAGTDESAALARTPTIPWPGAATE